MKSRTQLRSSVGAAVPFIVTAGVLILLLGDRVFLRMPPAQTEAYHAAVRQRAEQMPLTFGSWLGTDIPVPAAAVQMLHPNIIVSRRFHNIATEETVTLLLVHVKDARDLIGHYPPVCYAGQGWSRRSAEACDWSAGAGGGGVVYGTEYEFTRGGSSLGRGADVVVDNFFVMRGGTTCRDMDGVERAAQDRQRKFYGAAQVQLVHNGASEPERRRELVEEFVRFLEPTLDAISDVNKGA
jgi:hypothetical protein